MVTSPQLMPWRHRSSTIGNSNSLSPLDTRNSDQSSGTSVAYSPKAVSPVSDTTNPQQRMNRSKSKLSIGSSSKSSLSSPQIEDYCLGKPQKVNQSHSGNVELFVSLQEKAVFLPNIRKHRHQHHHNNNETNVDSAGRPASDSESDSMDEEDEDEDDESPQISPIDQGLDIQTGGSMENYAESTSPCSTLRGSVILKLSKPTKIKEVAVSFSCVSKTLWNILPPSAILVDSTLPNNTQIEDIAHIGIHHWDFVPLEQFAPAQASYDKLSNDQSSSLVGQDLYGADAAMFYNSKSSDQLHLRKFTRVYNNERCRIRGVRSHQVPVFGNFKHIPRKLKQVNVQSDGVVFPPGEYVYNFTLLVDAHTPGTVNVANGVVEYFIQAKVVRSGAFTPNLSGKLNVEVVRAPQDPASYVDWVPGNDEISVSRIWEDILVYAFHVGKKYLTLDSPMSMKIRLMALDGVPVKVHKIQVYAIENVSYMYSLDSGIKYSDPTKKYLVYENDAGDGDLLGGKECSYSTKIVLPSKHAVETDHKSKRDDEIYFEPDVRGPYIKVRHRFHAKIHVSYPSSKKASSVDNNKNNASGRVSNIIELNTSFSVLSRHCVNSSINLPSYFDNLNFDENNSTEEPPTFDDAMGHQLLQKSSTEYVPLKK